MKLTKAMLDLGSSFYQPTKKQWRDLNAHFDRIDLPRTSQVPLFEEMFSEYPLTLYEAQQHRFVEVWFAWPYPEQD